MGFIPCDTMYVMKKNLSGSKGMALSSIFKKASENGLKLLMYRPDPCEEFLREYCIANEEAFGRVESAVKARIDDYTNNYETYGPDQVAKLQSAVSRTVGQVLITVVSADNGAAQDVLAGLLK